MTLKQELIFLTICFWYGFIISMYVFGLEPVIFTQFKPETVPFFPQAILTWMLSLLLLIIFALRAFKSTRFHQKSNNGTLIRVP